VYERKKKEKKKEKIEMKKGSQMATDRIWRHDVGDRKNPIARYAAGMIDNQTPLEMLFPEFELDLPSRHFLGRFLDGSSRGIRAAEVYPNLGR